jgi:cellulose synthase/poly-beta-1,6-N-acetylglucosamine synthase-like glycosyltransferase
VMSQIFDAALFALGLALLARWGALVALSATDWAIRYARPLPGAPPSGVAWPPVAVIVPAYNEERVIDGTIASALAGDYPDLRVVVVDDGSSDATWERIVAWAARDPRVKGVAQRPNRGKAAALDAGIAACGTELVVTVDADTVLERDAVRRLIAPFLHDDRIGAVAGNVKVGNRRGLVTIFQSIEYITGLNLSRRTMHRLRCITTVPGAAGAWRRAAIAQVGGVPGDTRVEDTDLTIAIQRVGWRVVYQPDAVAFTEAPADWGSLVSQRTRWIWGFIQVAYKHRGGLFRHGALGWIGLPDLIYRNILAFLLLPLIFPGIWRLAVAFTWWGLLELLIGMVVFDLMASTLAYVEDRERWPELLHVPLRRLIWPWFLAGVLVRVLWLAGRDGTVPWAKLDRSGALARASQEPQGPRVVRRR